MFSRVHPALGYVFSEGCTFREFSSLVSTYSTEACGVPWVLRKDATVLTGFLICK